VKSLQYSVVAAVDEVAVNTVATRAIALSTAESFKVSAILKLL